MTDPIDTGDPRRDGIRMAMADPAWTQGPCAPCAACRAMTVWTRDGIAVHPFPPCWRGGAL